MTITRRLAVFAALILFSARLVAETIYVPVTPESPYDLEDPGNGRIRCRPAVEWCEIDSDNGIMTTSISDISLYEICHIDTRQTIATSSDPAYITKIVASLGSGTYMLRLTTSQGSKLCGTFSRDAN